MKNQIPLRILCGCFLLTFFSGCSPPQETGEVPPEETPMYGYDKRPVPPEEREIHDTFVKEIIAAAGSRPAALHDALSRAWEFYRAGEGKMAMKRFNQAWLLDPNSAEVFLGYALLVSETEVTDEAFSFYKKALALDPEYRLAMTNLALGCIRRATSLAQRYGRAREREYHGYLDQAEYLFQKALSLTSPDDDRERGYIYYKWAVVLAMREDFKGAWEKVKLSRTHGGVIDPGFIQGLSRGMPEPEVESLQPEEAS